MRNFEEYMNKNNFIKKSLFFLFPFLSLSCVTAIEIAPPVNNKFTREINTLLQKHNSMKKVSRLLDKKHINKLIFEMDKEKAFNEKGYSKYERFKTNAFLRYGFFTMRLQLGTNKNQLIFLHKGNSPHLTSLIHNLCEKLNIPTPLVLLCTDDNFINAAALSFMPSTSIIVIGKRYIDHATPRELTAIIGHELGHIKHYHPLKTIGLRCSLCLVFSFLGIKALDMLIDNISSKPEKIKESSPIAVLKFGILGASILAAYRAMGPYSRYTERQADQIGSMLAGDDKAMGDALKAFNRADDYLWQQRNKAYTALISKIKEKFSTNPILAKKIIAKIPKKKSLWHRFIYFLLKNSHPEDEER
jgi:Zn-dependent protease with chaperone function